MLTCCDMHGVMCAMGGTRCRVCLGGVCYGGTRCRVCLGGVWYGRYALSDLLGLCVRLALGGPSVLGGAAPTRGGWRPCGLHL